MLNSNLLRKLDMQDLMVFIAVYEQSSVTGVSESLCVSQSTVSYCLKKLRNAFEDELFINTRTGMRPTYKASTMYSHVLKILESINLCHSGAQAFDPIRQAVTFNICAPEYFELLILPRLLKQLLALGAAEIDGDFQLLDFAERLDTHLFPDNRIGLLPRADDDADLGKVAL